jgi:hypothetical protein
LHQRRRVIGFALAAAAVVVLISLVAITHQPGSRDDYHSIPAVSSWPQIASSLSEGITSTALFEQTIDMSHYPQYDVSHWRWLVFSRLPLQPQSPGHAYLSLQSASAPPGLNVIVVESGELSVEAEAEIAVLRSGDAIVTPLRAGVVATLAPGDALLYASSTPGRIWNSSPEETTIVGGGAYTRPNSPTFENTNGVGDANGQAAGRFGSGTNIAGGALPPDAAVSLQIEHVTIDPGGALVYTIQPNEWIIAALVDGALTRTTLGGDGHPISSDTLRISSYPLQESGPGTYRLTNPNDAPVSIYLLRLSVASPIEDTPAA